MTSVKEHYANHLANIYVWMVGGIEAALVRGHAEIDAICPQSSVGLTAIDLGAGFGMHAIPLARRGYSVVAVDSSAILLAVLSNHAAALPVRTVEDDLLAFPEHLDKKVDLVLCMGDTLTHLPDQESVAHLFSRVDESLQPGGNFIATFRDYTQPLFGASRFISVKSDSGRILTCFLEYSSDHVTVHDLLHEQDATATWRMRVSAYRKCILSPAWVSAALEARGFSVRVEPGPTGMVRVIATRR
jgi:SAM-dependent methyltransferase